MKTIFLLLALAGLFFSNQSDAQWYNPDKVNKKVIALNEKAYLAAIDGKYREAMALLDEAIKIDNRFVEGYLSRAGMHANLKDYESSVKDFGIAFGLDSVFSSTYLLPYSISLAGTGQFEKALRAVNEFLATPGLNEQSIKAGNYRKSTYEFAVKWAKDHAGEEYVFTPVNLSANVNTPALEYFPSLSIDGKKLVFTRRLNNDEDFYESELVDGQWTTAKPMGERINTNFNEAAQNISQDGELLVFTGCNYPEGEGSCDIYISRRKKNGSWSEPENIGRAINTEFWESTPSLSPDKNDLYFSSSRPGGFGGTDIWVSHRLSSGKWGVPENLGPEINTAGNEGCPFIHADNQSLYFNSDGHAGYGTTDLFVSRRQADDNWGRAMNLGYPINTIGDEGSLYVAADGRTGYYSSDKSDTRGGLDIYSFQLRKEVSALKTLWAKGKVFDKATGKGLPSRIELTDLRNRKLVSSLQTDEDGNYLVTLPQGYDYAFNVNRKGYLFYSENFSLHDNASDSVFVIDIPLEPIVQGAGVVLRNIFFDVNQYKLKPESAEELDRVVMLMKENPGLKIEISGHTDNVGRPADNLTLSINRAKEVVNYLVSHGIDNKRLSYKGYGETKPVSSNETEAGKSRNRRTELNIVSIQ